MKCTLLFPSRGFSDLVNRPFSKEPQDVNKLIVKLEGLDARKEFGATVADSIFPKFTAKPAAHENAEPEATTNSD
ncbi:hypothetical protein FACS189430_08720 [Bacteroidia bacterium]|nr:hypothetical protein FACS189430_08720 [Bacteroidia bacterium]